MPKTITSIGFAIPGHDSLEVEFQSKYSLMDADVILFSPSLPYYQKSPSGNGLYQGKKCYGDTGSFELKDDIAHWKKELTNALNAGKTIFFLLAEKDDFFVDSGDRSHSGTGRNQKTTILVSPYDNYKVLPIDIGSIHSAHGNTILHSGNALFKEFYSYFKDYLEYKLYLQNVKNGVPIFTGKDRTKILGGYIPVGKGHLVLLPYLEYDEIAFTEEKKNDSGKIEEFWNDAGIQFGNVLINHLIAIDKALSETSEKTLTPTWVNDVKFKNTFEINVEKAIGEKIDLIQSIELEITNLKESLTDTTLLKGLLYEQGKPLEQSVIKALTILGYNAENYSDGDLELDQVIISPEGHRYIGECEGKDDKDIDVTKFRQLLESMSADFDREEVTEKAFGIIFGNPQRLRPLDERTLDFTRKCKIGAERDKIALIKTSDLFVVASYLSCNKNPEFQKKCRDAIHNNLGSVVTFPLPPSL